MFGSIFCSKFSNSVPKKWEWEQYFGVFRFMRGILIIKLNSIGVGPHLITKNENKILKMKQTLRVQILSPHYCSYCNNWNFIFKKTVFTTFVMYHISFCRTYYFRNMYYDFRVFKVILLQIFSELHFLISPSFKQAALFLYIIKLLNYWCLFKNKKNKFLMTWYNVSTNCSLKWRTLYPFKQAKL